MAVDESNSGDSLPDPYDPADPKHAAQGGLAFVMMVIVFAIGLLAVIGAAIWVVAMVLRSVF